MKRASRVKPTFQERHALLGAEPLWTRTEVGLYLGLSLETVDHLPIPRANIGGPRFVPDVVRAWAAAQLDRQLPPKP